MIAVPSSSPFQVTRISSSDIGSPRWLLSSPSKVTISPLVIFKESVSKVIVLVPRTVKGNSTFSSGKVSLVLINVTIIV